MWELQKMSFPRGALFITIGSSGVSPQQKLAAGMVSSEQNIFRREESSFTLLICVGNGLCFGWQLGFCEPYAQHRGGVGPNPEPFCPLCYLQASSTNSTRGSCSQITSCICKGLASSQQEGAWRCGIAFCIQSPHSPETPEGEISCLESVTLHSTQPSF